MGLHFLVGASGSGKTKRIYERMIERARENPGKNYLIIVPEQFTMQTQKDLVSLHPSHGIMNIDVLSFGRLSHRIFDAAGGSHNTILDDTGKSLILRRIAAEQEQELSVLGRNLHKLGYINEVKSVISEFLQYDISQEKLQEILQKNENKSTLSGKIRDLNLLYQKFSEYMKDRYLTTEELLDYACKKAGQASFLKNSEIYFDGFTGFTPVQNRFLVRMMELTKELTVSIILGSGECTEHGKDLLSYAGRAEEQDLFYLSYHTIDNLNRFATEKNIPVDEPEILWQKVAARLRNSEELSFLEQEIFRFSGRKCTTTKQDISILETGSMREEAAMVGRKIHELVRTQGYRYRDIAILTGDTAAYEKILRTELIKYDIPFFVDSTFGILLNPFTEMIRAILEVIMNHFSYESVFRYLKSGLAGFTWEEIDGLDNYIRASGIRGRKKYEQPFEYIPDYMNSENAQEMLQHLNELRSRLSSQFQQISDIMSTKKEQKASVFVEALYTCIHEMGIYQKLLKYEEYFKEKGDLARAKEYGQIYEHVMELLDRIMQLMPDEIITTEEFSDILDAGFGEIRVGIIPPGVDQVLIGDMQRSRLCNVKALFLLGVNDGAIPANSRKGGILSEMDREILSQQNVELSPTTRQQAYIQRMYLYMYLTKPEQKLYLSYPLVSADGTALRPSYLIAHIQKLYTDKEICVLKQTDASGSEAEKEMQYKQLLTPLEGLDTLVSELRQVHQGEEEEQYHQLLYYYANKEEYQEILKNILEKSFAVHTDDPVSAAVATALYGKILENSVTRLEQFASCAYSHFLQYGLCLQEKEEFRFETKDMGTIFHGVLDEYAKLLAKSEYDWFNVPEDVSESMLNESLNSCMKRYEKGVIYSTARNEYAINRIRRILKRTVSVLLHQVRKGSFVPNEYEVAFREVSELSTKQGEETELRLRGRIDRLDTCETEDCLYVKVIDYKSGSKSFDLVSVYYGLSLQLMVYLNAAKKLEKKKAAVKDIVPAGVLYYHIDDPIIDRPEQSTPEEIKEKIEETLVMKGLVNSDEAVIRMLDGNFEDKSVVIPVKRNKDGSLSKTSCVATREEMDMISDYVNHEVVRLGKRILEGEIAVNPYQFEGSGGKSACDYCGYKSICGFDPASKGFHYRELINMKDEEAKEAIRVKEAEK